MMYMKTAAYKLLKALIVIAGLAAFTGTGYLWFKLFAVAFGTFLETTTISVFIMALIKMSVISMVMLGVGFLELVIALFAYAIVDGAEY